MLSFYSCLLFIPISINIVIVKSAAIMEALVGTKDFNMIYIAVVAAWNKSTVAVIDSFAAIINIINEVMVEEEVILIDTFVTSMNSQFRLDIKELEKHWTFDLDKNLTMFGSASSLMNYSTTASVLFENPAPGDTPPFAYVVFALNTGHHL